MSTVQHEFRHCDRCGRKSDEVLLHDNFAATAHWGKIYARLGREIGVIGSGDGNNVRSDDICPNCVDELRRWWKSVDPNNALKGN